MGTATQQRLPSEALWNLSIGAYRGSAGGIGLWTYSSGKGKRVEDWPMTAER